MPPEGCRFAARGACATGFPRFRAVRAACHENHHLHRGPAAAGAPPGSARVLRLCRRRLLHRGDAARQPRRPRSDQAAPARPGATSSARSLATTMLGEKASLPLVLAPVGLLRHAARRRRNPRRAGGATRPAFPSRSRPCRSARSRTSPAATEKAVLVPALRHQGSRLLARICSSAPQRPNATRSCSPSICKCSASATATSRTA